MFKQLLHALKAGVLALVLIGCGSATEPEVVTQIAQSKPGLNGGMAFPLPENLGYAEVVIERSKPGAPVVLAVYFLDESVTKEIASEPASVSATLELPTEETPKTVSLTAKAATNGKAGKGRKFVSAPGAYDFDELKGKITASVNGKEVSVPFAMR